MLKMLADCFGLLRLLGITRTYYSTRSTNEHQGVDDMQGADFRECQEHELRLIRILGSSDSGS